jgi:DMSO/TMAO reductase YedYZ heme-binding membrane subunit
MEQLGQHWTDLHEIWYLSILMAHLHAFLPQTVGYLRLLMVLRGVCFFIFAAKNRATPKHFYSFRFP